jgi:ABC-type antimicrobial peptide transport system permease subunit
LDPVTISLGSLLLLLATLAAAFIPARRAARVDPLEALRGE